MSTSAGLVISQTAEAVASSPVWRHPQPPPLCGQLNVERLKQEIFELNRDKTAMFWKYHQQLQIVDAVLAYDSFDETGDGDVVYGSCAQIIKKMQLEI